MRIPGKTMQDHLMMLAPHIEGLSYVDQQNVSCSAGIYPSSVFIDFRSIFDRNAPHRPYLHIVGECRSLKKADGTVFYGDVSEIIFGESKGIPVDFFYDFSDDELVNMTKLGLYRRGFKCPDVIRDSELEMPVTCSLRIIEPQGENDLPVIFADIDSRHFIETTSQQCGYAFGEYFEPAPVIEEVYDEFGDFVAFDEKQSEVATEKVVMPEFELPQEEVEKVEKRPKLTPRQELIESHYANVKKRVERDHMAVQSENEVTESDITDDFVADDMFVENVEDKAAESTSEVEIEESLVDVVEDDVFSDYTDEDEVESETARQIVVETNVAANEEREPKPHAVPDFGVNVESSESKQSDDYSL